MRLAMMFPGQGSQSVGMGQDLAAAYPEAASVFAHADRVLGYSIAEKCFHGPLETLTETRYAQPALLTHSVAVLRVLAARGVEPAVVAGHSLGEYSALVAAQVLDFASALRLVQRRGELMFECGVETPGTMAAVVGAPIAAVEAACEAARDRGVCGIANLNSPDQTVISGAVPAVLEAMRRLEAGGAKLVKQLNVSGAFHSALMRGPGEALGEALRAATFQDATVPVIPNVTAVPEQAGAALRDLLRQQISSPVRWEESMRSLRKLAQGPVLEVGNGTVLKGLLRRIEREAEAVSIADAAGLEAFLSKTPTG